MAEWLPIIECLRQDARISLTEMSRVTGIPITTLAGRIKAMEERQVIRRYTTHVDFGTLGYPIRIYLRAKPADGGTNGARMLEQKLGTHPRMNRLARTEAGDGGLWLQGEYLFPTVSELNAFIRDVKGDQHCAELDIHYVQEVLGDETLGFTDRGDA